jgi:hypothetical protein
MEKTLMRINGAKFSFIFGQKIPFIRLTFNLEKSDEIFHTSKWRFFRANISSSSFIVMMLGSNKKFP